MTETTVQVPFDGGAVDVRYTIFGGSAADGSAAGGGPPVLLLHGGAGPVSVAGWGEQYAAAHCVRVLAPTHPGFDGTARPDALDSIAALARLYRDLLDVLDLTDVTVVGNSIGGWVAAELGILGSPRVARTVVVNAVGLDLPDAPIADFFTLTMDEVVERSYFRPERYGMDVDALPDAAKQAMARNREALHAYGGDTMADPTLLGRLPRAAGPALVVWGAADRIVPPEHGEVYARELPGARLIVIPDAGHLPQLETPDTLDRLVSEFVTAR